MIDPDYVTTMARYNRWQNSSLYQAADTLSDRDRRADRGAFFGSIHDTLCHILWGDQMWMSRFAQIPAPQVAIKQSGGLVADWDALRAEREAFDGVIETWASGITTEELAGDLTWYSGAAQREITAPRGLLIVHMFNHQTHHRGQVHAMLTAAGARPDDTDLMMLAFKA